MPNDPVNMPVAERWPDVAESDPWFAISVKTRQERMVAQLLSSKGFAQFLPLYRSPRQWSDRIKVLEVPLFAGYLFCRFQYTERFKVLQTPGVRKIVGTRKGPNPVPEEEITAVRSLIQARVPIEPYPFLNEGQRVVITCGPLTGVHGFVQRAKSVKKLVVSVGMLQRSVAVELDRRWVAVADSRFSSTAERYERQLAALEDSCRVLSPHLSADSKD